MFNRKPNKIWVHKGSDIYNILIKLWLPGSDIEVYLTRNEIRSVTAVRL